MEEFLDTFNSYPLVQKVLVFGILVVGLFLGFWYMLYSPLQGKIDTKEGKLKRKSKELRDLKQRKANQKQLMDKIEQLQADIVVAKDKLPNSAQLPDLLRSVHGKAKTAGLEIQNFQPGNQRAKKFYLEIPVAVELTGTFGELIEFFRSVDRMERIINFHDLELTRSESEGTAGELTVKATATTYQYREGGK